MIAIAIILAISAAAIVAVIGLFWSNIVGWIQKATKKLEEVLGIAVKGTKTFIKRTTDGLQNISKYYNIDKVTGEWEENIYMKAVLPAEVPEDILMKLENSELDEECSTTEEFKLELARI